MTISSVATTTAPLATVNNFSSSGSIADIANQFSSLLANFSAAATTSSNSQPASGAAAPASSNTSASTSGSQGSSLPAGVAAFLFVQTTTTSGPAPAQSTPRPLFASTDTSGDGLIDRQEFVNKFGANGDQDSASQLFDIMDKNGDSSIDGTELASSKSGSPANGPTAPASSSDVMWSPSSLFQTLPGMQSASIPGLSNLPLFTRLDADQNGLLSATEFGAAFGSNASQATSSFGDVDGNGNGSIDWSELNKAQLSSSPSAAAASNGSTTTTTTFFAELIQLQAAQSATSSAPGPGADATASGSAASTTTGSSDSTNSTGSSTNTTSTAPASSGSAPSPTTTGGSTTAGSSDPATSDPSAALANAMTSGTTAPQTDSSQTVANLQSGLLDALNPTASSNNTSTTG